MKIAKTAKKSSKWLGKDDQLKIALHLKKVPFNEDNDPDELLNNVVKYAKKQIAKVPVEIRPNFLASFLTKIA